MRRPPIFFFVLLFAVSSLPAQNTLIITTVAGGGPDEVAVVSAAIFPQSLSLDASGNLFVSSESRIFRVTPAGIVRVAVGSGVPYYCGDGVPAEEACLTNVGGVALDSNGNLYAADTDNHRIRRVDAATGLVTTYAGTGLRPGEVDGPGGDPSDDLGDGGQAVSAALNYPSDIAFDPDGNLVIADTSSHRIRRVDSASGVITTIVGTGDEGYNGDGIPADIATLAYPREIRYDAAGNLFIADEKAMRIRRVDGVSNEIATVAGNGNPTGWLDGEGGDPVDDLGDGGPATSATLHAPAGIYLDGDGNLYIADVENHRIRRVDAASGIITTVAGNGRPTGYLDGRGGDPADDFQDGVPATSTTLHEPSGVAVDSTGDLYIGDSGNGRIRRVDHATGLITSLSGDPATSRGDGRPATSAQIGALAVAVDAAGNLFIGTGDRVRRVDAVTGIVTTMAGCVDPDDCHAGEGLLATRTRILDLSAVALDHADNLYIASRLLNSVVKVDGVTGIVSRVAGTGQQGLSGDGGPATDAAVGQPRALAFDATGNLFISQNSYYPPVGPVGSAIRRVDATTGIITTVAGGGFGPDGGPAIGAYLASTNDIAIDVLGNLYIAEPTTSHVRRVDAATGTIGTLPAQLVRPEALALDNRGGLLVADLYDDRVVRIDLASGAVTPLAGSGEYGFSGDGGPALAARLSAPFGLAFSARGDFFIVDQLSSRVRRVSTLVRPVADPGADRTEPCVDTGGTPVALDGSRSVSASGAPLGYTWTGPFAEGDGVVMGVGPTVTLPLGPSQISLVVNDGADSDPEEVAITVALDTVGMGAPLGGLVPSGGTATPPERVFRRGSTLPLKVELRCGGSAVADLDVPAPRLVALTRDGVTIAFASTNPGKIKGGQLATEFRYAGDGEWVYALSTKDMMAGRYVMTIETPDGLRYDAGFTLD